jgi:hypothetical protein
MPDSSAGTSESYSAEFEPVAPESDELSTSQMFHVERFVDSGIGSCRFGAHLFHVEQSRSSRKATNKQAAAP